MRSRYFIKHRRKPKGFRVFLKISRKTARGFAYSRTRAIKRVLSGIPTPTTAIGRAAAAEQVGRVIDAAKSVLSGRRLPLRFEDARLLNPRLTFADFTEQWEKAIRAAIK
jgi:hypothetical protein